MKITGATPQQAASQIGKAEAAGAGAQQPANLEELGTKLLENLTELQEELMEKEAPLIEKKQQEFEKKYGERPHEGDRLTLQAAAQKELINGFVNEVGRYFTEHVAHLSPEQVREFPATVDRLFDEDELTAIEQDQLKIYLEGLVQYKPTVEQLQTAMSGIDSLPEEFEAKDAWRLVVDGKRQQPDTDYYEFDAHEPGYVQGTLSAMTEALRTIGEPVTAKSIHALHVIASKDVYNQDGMRLHSDYRNNFTMTFAVTKGTTASEDGLREIEERSKTDGDVLNGWVTTEDIGRGKVQLNYRKATHDELERRLTKAADKYTAQIAAAKTDDEKLTAIAELAKNVDQIHVFSDANLRTAYLLANRLLIENGMPPMILHDPNMIDAHTTPELVAIFKEGQQKFLEVCAPSHSQQGASPRPPEPGQSV